MQNCNRCNQDKINSLGIDSIITMTKTQESQPAEQTKTSAEFESLKRLYEREKAEHILERKKHMQALVGFKGYLDLLLKVDRSIQSVVVEKMGDLSKVINTTEQVNAQVTAMIEEMQKEDQELINQEQGQCGMEA